ncbi:MAG TPA: hypothetical protein VMI75_31755 [Polyangiaceae bacterium]|nr:hypothetical protein [Polyangiaceae bacterium]
MQRRTSGSIAPVVPAVLTVKCARALAGFIVIAVACACSSSEQDSCNSGTTKVCLPDGTTCTCAPSCGPPSNCASHKICRKGVCAQCTSKSCTCSSDVCIPATWSSGDAVTFQ